MTSESPKKMLMFVARSAGKFFGYIDILGKLNQIVYDSNMRAMEEFSTLNDCSITA
uniref:Uncharacterized protein n=1 Tax=Romanomermis culicivorax TaxID=13658 RepID=A0A915J9H6_ROMCU